MPKYVIVAEFQVTRDALPKFMEAANRIASTVAGQEPGCERYDVITSVDEPGRGMIYEVYEDLAAFEAHRESSHFAQFFKDIDLIDVRWTSARYLLD
jgi:quinol monooxygenase YgiN